MTGVGPGKNYCRAVRNQGQIGQSDWNDWHREHSEGPMDYHNPYRRSIKQAQISHWISAMMSYDLQDICMCQTLIILLRGGPQNNARLKPVRSAKKVADTCAGKCFLVVNI